MRDRRIQRYQKLLAANPQDRETRYKLLELLEQHGRKQEVTQELLNDRLCEQCNPYFDYQQYETDHLKIRSLFAGWIIQAYDGALYYYSHPRDFQHFLLQSGAQLPGEIAQPDSYLLSQTFQVLPDEEVIEGVVHRFVSWDEDFAIACRGEDFYSLVYRIFS